MAMMSIGGYTFPNPMEYSVERDDLDSDNTGRSESGVMQRDRVRAGVYKVNAKFRVTGAILKGITTAIAPASFSLTFFDPNTSSSPTKTMYAGNRVGTLVKNVDDVIATSEWDLTIAIVEF